MEKGNTAEAVSGPQVKICGITKIDDALECAKLGADAIGCVFYPKSPRHLTDNEARAICLAVPKQVQTVGVFVNETYSSIMQRVQHCRLSAVQLHGQESPNLISRLRKEKLTIIKTLFVNGTPAFKEASNYHASAFLLECGQGKLPGGNALKWNWAMAKNFGNNYPLIIAGGLSPNNISYAIDISKPHAVDVSSGVEKKPGIKDLVKVAAFIDAAAYCKINHNFNKIF